MEDNLFNDEPKPQMQAQPKKRSFSKKKFLFVAALLAIAMTFFVIRPAIIGYSVYGDIKGSGMTANDYKMDIAKLSGELENVKGSLSACESNVVSATENANALNSDLESKDAQIESLTKDLEDVKKSLEKKDESIAKVEENLKEAKDQSKELKNNYEDLAKNAARSICCKNKIDNPNINFYSAEDGVISCSEEKGEELKCW
jgi:chromosome segregation ATPase